MIQEPTVTQLAYGKGTLPLTIDPEWQVDIIEPRFTPGIADLPGAIRAALQNPIGKPPLAEWVGADDIVGIILNDITRPAIDPVLFQALLAELSFLPPENIKLFIALGSHRANTDDEIRSIVGNEVFKTYTIIQNDAFDPDTQLQIGTTSRGNEVWINRELMECSVKILTGFIEPHFFAGFSGGGKAIMPGMAGIRTIFGNHSERNIADLKSTWGITEGNPLWEEIMEIAHLAGADFLVNYAMNRDKQVTGLFIGDLDAAHAEGVAHVREASMAAVEQPYDIVVTTNSGYPLDLNLYQSVKGMSAAAQIVKSGGAIICAAECWDGIPEHGLFRELLEEAASPQDLLDRLATSGHPRQDQWQAQIQAMVQCKAQVYLYSNGLSDDQIRDALLTPSADVYETIEALLDEYGPGARIGILPMGPQTIPYIAS
ncbi:nickel-dependent lactate racemase [bacterium]|nr:nickel-dependent lactate racemase [bacterium]